MATKLEKKVNFLYVTDTATGKVVNRIICKLASFDIKEYESDFQKYLNFNVYGNQDRNIGSFPIYAANGTTLIIQDSTGTAYGSLALLETFLNTAIGA